VAERVLLSQKNIDLLAQLADKLGSAKEVQADPNFVLYLLLRHMNDRPTGSIMGALFSSINPNRIQVVRRQSQHDMTISI
jgi:hypothetical protein